MIYIYIYIYNICNIHKTMFLIPLPDTFLPKVPRKKLTLVMTSLQRLTPGRLSLFKNKNGDKQTLNVLTLNKFLMGNFPDFDGVLTLITLF